LVSNDLDETVRTQFDRNKIVVMFYSTNGKVVFKSFIYEPIL